MGDRLDLQKVFEELLGTRNVYFQPPESTKMKYPAIRYSVKRIDTEHANNAAYKLDCAYSVVVMDYDPDSVIAKKMLTLPMCSFDRYYTVNNLNHFIYTLYY